MDAIAQTVTATLKRMETDKAAEEARIKELEAQGWRIVDGGTMGDGEWDWTDYRTNEVLASNETHDGDPFDAWGERWYHIDRITDDTHDFSFPNPCGLPEELCNAIGDWAEMKPDEAQAWLNGLAKAA
jgi:hypothetical protein